MYLIRNRADHKARFTPEQTEEFARKCEAYIQKLRDGGHLIAAQPIERQGKILYRHAGEFKTISYDELREIWVGYYHILANDLDQALALAQENPEFEYGTTATIEVRPVKVMEECTGFYYPSPVQASAAVPKA